MRWTSLLAYEAIQAPGSPSGKYTEAQHSMMDESWAEMGEGQKEQGRWRPVQSSVVAPLPIFD